MSRHILLIGGHGKIAQLLTPLLLQRSWTVTSLIRAQEQTAQIESLKQGQQGSLNVFVGSLDDIQDEAQAKSILDKIKPDYVVWSAGAGGKGGAERTQHIDGDVCTYFIKAAAATPSITRFLLISYLDSRREQPSWWDADRWQAAQAVNEKLAAYYRAKIGSDEALYRASRARRNFVGINLRPSTLTDEPAGKVELGKPTSRADTSRASVAAVAALLLEKEGVRNGWYDLVDGDEEAQAAVDRVVKDRVNAADGDPVYLEKFKGTKS